MKEVRRKALECMKSRHVEQDKSDGCKNYEQDQRSAVKATVGNALKEVNQD